jgi:predicted glycoside hydrolase/deacetylase ChbG (UPF0249 family)
MSLLIVNADDFGGNPLATDRIVECFAMGAITSASAMMYMRDSLRAAELARSRELSLGLHLNLTQEFEDSSVPTSVRERQARAVRYFAAGRRRRFTYNPLLGTLVRACVADQLACFRRLFGVEPTHIDGHNHVHLSPTVLFALPRGMCVRSGESHPHATASPGAMLGRARHALIAHRQITTDHFFAIDRLGASPTAGAIEALLRIAEQSTVEVMTHPDRERDYRVLASEQWHSALRRHARGSFAELAVMCR